jgi:hypothetical protein
VPFYIFSTGCSLLVIGFTFAFVSSTIGLTEFKNNRSKFKTILVGIASLMAGFLIIYMGFKSDGNEKDTILNAGSSISTIGISTLIQFTLNERTQRVFRIFTWIIIILGFMLCAIYKMYTA